MHTLFVIIAIPAIIAFSWFMWWSWPNKYLGLKSPKDQLEKEDGNKNMS